MEFLRRQVVGGRCGGRSWVHQWAQAGPAIESLLILPGQSGQAQRHIAPAAAMIVRTPGKPAKCQAIAPPATPRLPARNVHALMMPEPCPACSGDRAESASRGAAAYGNARPAPMATKPISMRGIAGPDAATPMMAQATTISVMHPIIARRSPMRAVTIETERASTSSAALSGSSAAPACSGVRPRPPSPWA